MNRFHMWFEMILLSCDMITHAKFMFLEIIFNSLLVYSALCRFLIPSSPSSIHFVEPLFLSLSCQFISSAPSWLSSSPAALRCPCLHLFRWSVMWHSLYVAISYKLFHLYIVNCCVFSAILFSVFFHKIHGSSWMCPQAFSRNPLLQQAAYFKISVLSAKSHSHMVIIVLYMLWYCLIPDFSFIPRYLYSCQWFISSSIL